MEVREMIAFDSARCNWSTYHHLINGIDYVQHLVTGDVAIII